MILGLLPLTLPPLPKEQLWCRDDDSENRDMHPEATSLRYLGIWVKKIPVARFKFGIIRKEEMVGSWWMIAMTSKKRILMFWCALQSWRRPDSTLLAAGETHDHLMTTPGGVKFKFDETPMMSCWTSSTVRPLYCGIAIGNWSCEKVS